MHQFILKMFATAGAMAGQSQKPGTSFVSIATVVGTPALNPSPAASQDEHL